jgi:hypothetical protein
VLTTRHRLALWLPALTTPIHFELIANPKDFANRKEEINFYVILPHIDGHYA